MEIGDKVKIINRGKVYQFYRKMFIKMRFRNLNENKVETCRTDVEFIIFGKERHFIMNDIITCGIRNEFGDELLINESGLELIEENRITHVFTEEQLIERDRKIYVHAYNKGKNDFVNGEFI